MKKHTYSILIIDDAFFLRNLIKKAIAKKPGDDLDYDFEILTEAQNGEEGLELYQIVKPDIVTVDINMPKLNGIEFIKKLKKLNPYSKIIVISANLASEYKDKAIEAGAFGYIQKPFQDAYLWSRLDAIAEELKKENFDISKFSTDNNISNVAIPTIKNNKSKTKPKHNSNNLSNNKDNLKKIEEGADLFSSIIVDDKINENINKNNNHNSHKNKESKSYQHKNDESTNNKKNNKEENEDNFSFLDSLIVKDTSNKQTDVNKNIRDDKKDYVHKKDKKKKSFDKNNKTIIKNNSLENKKQNNEVIDISSIIKKEIEVNENISKNTNIEDIKIDTKKSTNDNYISKDNVSSIDNLNNIDNKTDKLQFELSNNEILENINNADEIIPIDTINGVIENNEIVIEDNEEIVIEDNEEIVIDDNDEIVINDNDDDEEIIIEDNDEDIVIDNNSDNTYSDNINSENYLEDNITYNIDEFVVHSEIQINLSTQNEITEENTNTEPEEEPIANEKQTQTIDYRSPFSSGNAEFILSGENDEHSADIVHENSYKKEDENISYNYNNSSNIENTPKITPPVNNKYKELYNEKIEREYNISFDDVTAEQPKEEEKLGFFARLFGRKKKNKNKR